MSTYNEEPGAAADLLLCEPEAASFATGISPPYGHPMDLGQASAVMTVGSSNVSLHDLRLVALGAAPDTDLEGFVQIVEANVSTSQLNSSSTNNLQILPADVPGGGVEYQFGDALAAGNINDCRTVSTWDYACGQELLIGAPDTGTGSTGGAVYLFEPNNDPAVEPILVYADEVVDPNAIAGAQFGASITIASDNPPDFSPWETSDLSPSWVAVGAPGDERVEVFWVDPTAAPGGTPFTHAMTLTNPGTSGAFGSVVLADDLTSDGHPELIVAAPDGVGGGAVWIYRGTGSSTTPLEMVGLNVTRYSDTALPGAVHPDEFGAALAAGPIIFDRNSAPTRQHALLVGMPGYIGQDASGSYPDSGAVCQLRVGPDNSVPSGLAVDSSLCEDRLPLFAPTPGWRIGESLAVGNFVASDKNSNYYSQASLLSDIAVGVPGFSSDQGAIWVMASQSDGLNFAEITTILTDPFGMPGERYGAHLSSGYVGEMLWGDLVIGQPVVEQAALTRATALNPTSLGACPDLTGWWEVDTQRWDPSTASFDDKTAKFVVWEEGPETVVVFQRALYLNVSVPGDTEPCMIDVLDGNRGPGCHTLIQKQVDKGTSQYQYAANAIPRGTILRLPSTCAAAYDSASNTYTWSGVPVGDVIEGNVDPGLWDVLGDSNREQLRLVEADITISLSGGSASTATLDVDLDWANKVWPYITAGSCDFNFGSTCTDYSPQGGVSGASPELPAAGLRTKESVCED